MKKPAKATDDMQPNNALNVEHSSEITGAQAMAKLLLGPDVRHAVTASAYSAKLLGKEIEAPGIGDFIEQMQAITRNAEAGDLAPVSRMLAAQAVSLDGMFTELSRRAAHNMGDYIEAAERYGRLALKAQSNCRATLETLAKLHQPREQTVRHVHVNEGGQAVIADQFHHHGGGGENAESVKQSHATGAAGGSATLPSANPFGNGVPITGSAREAPVPDARRDESGGALRQS